MEEQVLLSVKTELLLPVESVSPSLSPELQLDAAQKSPQKEIIFQGETVHGFLVVKLPDGSRSQGRAIDDWSHYYANLSLSLQLLSTSPPESPQRQTIEASSAPDMLVPATSLAKSGTLAGAFCVMGAGGAGSMEGAWAGSAGPGLRLPGRAVLYRFQTAVAVEPQLFAREVTLRVVVSPPSFPCDEAAFPVPFALNPPRPESAPRSVHGLYARHLASKGLRPTLSVEQRLEVADPLVVTAHVASLHAQVLLSLNFHNKRRDRRPLAVTAVALQAADGRPVHCHWLGAGPPAQRGEQDQDDGEGVGCFGEGSGGVEVGAGGSVSVACRVEGAELGPGPGRRLVLWWRGEGVDGSGGGGGVMRAFSMESLLGMASHPEQDSVLLAFHSPTQFVVGERAEVCVSVTNRGPAPRRLRLHVEGEGEGALRCLTREVEVGAVVSGQSAVATLAVLGVRGGVGGLGAVRVVDKDGGQSMLARTEWKAKVVQPGSLRAH